MATAADKAAALDDRETALNDRAAELDRRTITLDERETALDTIGQAQAAMARDLKDAALHRDDFTAALADRESAVTEREAQVAHRVVGALPPVQDGNGLAVVELPAHIVGVLAIVHPAERASIAAQLGGLLGEALAQTGKGNLMRDTSLVADLAIILVAEPATDELAPLMGSDS